MIITAAIIILIGCVKDPAKLGIHPNTLYKGRVIEKSQNKPIKGVTVSVSDGSHVHVSKVTGDDGRFELYVDFEALNENYALHLDCQGYNSVKEELKGMGQETYDYRDIVFFDNGNSSNWPIITTTAIADITSTTARTGGTITYSGPADITSRGVCWGINHNPTIDSNHTEDGAGIGTFISDLTNLTLNTTYFVRAYAKNMHGIYYGNEVSFITTNGLPIVTISSVNNITATSAVCSGDVTSDGGYAVTEKGLCWSTYQYPTIEDSHVSLGTGTGYFTGSMTGLSLGATYYVRAYATNSQGTVYSDQKSFITANGLPTITTTAPTKTGTTVTTGGTITSDGGYAITARGVCYGIIPYPDLSSAHNHTTNGSGTGSYSSTFTMSGTGVYYIRAYATNANGTVYGEQKTIGHPYNDLPTFTFGGRTYRVAPPADNTKNWTNANSYCNNLTLYGYSDWRLPTKDELLQMYADRESIGGFNTGYWWSGTSASSDRHYSVYFYNGNVYSERDSNLYYVRPIRVEN